MKVADGFTARRSIVSNDKCNSCHGQLGVAPSFHSGARNNGEGCATGGCHDANKATGHVGAANGFGGGWSVAAKNLIHGIHGASKRDKAFTYEATAANPDGFEEVTYPGVLQQLRAVPRVRAATISVAPPTARLCPTCSGPPMPAGDMSNPTSAASIGLSPWVTMPGRRPDRLRTNNLVSSPIASSCFGCHDSSLAVQHMELNGGTLVRRFSTVSSVATRPAIGAASTMTFTKAEQCMLCHAQRQSGRHQGGARELARAPLRNE